MTEYEFISSESGVLLRGRLIAPTEPDTRPGLVIMLTGDGPKGSKSLSWVNMPPKLLEVGIASFLFDFQGLGYSEGDRRSLSLSAGIDNFKSAFEFVKTELDVNVSKIAAFASSFGATVLLESSDIANQLCSIGLKSPASFLADAYYKEIGDKLFDEWREKGLLEENGYDFSVFKDSLMYNTYKSSRDITTPCLITQGDNDEIIEIQHSKYLFESLGSSKKRLEIFKGASHGYSEGDSWERMATMFVSWFAEHN